MRTIGDESIGKVDSLGSDEKTRWNVFLQPIPTPSTDDDSPIPRTKVYLVISYTQREDVRHAKLSGWECEEMLITKELFHII
ncbi:hypothetical protein ACJQWK_11986 [Exserohilum turcicum]